MIKVIIVDDHPLFRGGISLMLNKCASDIEVIGEAENVADLLKILLNKKPDIILLDISLPDRNGIDAIKDIQKIHREVPVLILTMHPEKRFSIRALKAGASGYLSKMADSKELINAIHTVVNKKKKYINMAVAEELANQLSNNGTKMPHELLSDREYEVFHSIVKGKRISKIADDLSLSVQTIHTYQSRIKEKMEMESKTELIWYALEHHLVE